MPYVHTESENLYEQFLSVRRRLAETTAGYYTDLEIYRYLNRGQTYIVRKSRCLKKEVTITTVASTQEYDLKDNSFADIIDISEDGVYFNRNGTSKQELTYKSKATLDRESPGWRDKDASTPLNYYYNKTTKTIGLDAKPNSSNAGAYLFVSGYHLPKVLHAGTADSGTTSTIVLQNGSTTAPYPSVTDDYYNNLFIEIYSGTGVGQRVEITDYVASSRTCTASFTTAPDSTSVYGMVPQIPEDAQYLMELYALWKLWAKGGSRTNLANNFRAEFFDGLNLFIGEFQEDSDQDLQRSTYRM